MLRKWLAVLLAVTIFAGVILADQVKGKFKKWDKGTITLTVKDKDMDYKYKNKDVKVFNGDEEVKDKGDRATLFKDLKEGTQVTITYDKEGDTIKVKEIKVKK